MRSGACVCVETEVSWRGRKGSEEELALPANSWTGGEAVEAT